MIQLATQFGSPFCVLYSVNLCFFDKLQTIIAQFDLALFATWLKKEKDLASFASWQKKEKNW